MRRGSRLVIAALLASFLPSCAVHLVSDYDERVDALATDIHRKSALHFAELREQTAPDCAYPAHAGFYRSIHADVETLRLRALSAPDNAQTARAAQSLADTFDLLRRAHAAAATSPSGPCMHPALLKADETAIDSAIGGILKFELAKKRGK